MVVRLEICDRGRNSLSALSANWPANSPMLWHLKTCSQSIKERFFLHLILFMLLRFYVQDSRKRFRTRDKEDIEDQTGWQIGQCKFVSVCELEYVAAWTP